MSWLLLGGVEGEWFGCVTLLIVGPGEAGGYADLWPAGCAQGLS